MSDSQDGDEAHARSAKENLNKRTAQPSHLRQVGHLPAATVSMRSWNLETRSCDALTKLSSFAFCFIANFGCSVADQSGILLLASRTIILICWTDNSRLVVVDCSFWPGCVLEGFVELETVTPPLSVGAETSMMRSALSGESAIVYRPQPSIAELITSKGMLLPPRFLRKTAFAVTKRPEAVNGDGCFGCCAGGADSFCDRAVKASVTTSNRSVGLRYIGRFSNDVLSQAAATPECTLQHRFVHTTTERWVRFHPSPFVVGPSDWRTTQLDGGTRIHANIFTNIGRPSGDGGIGSCSVHQLRAKFQHVWQ